MTAHHFSFSIVRPVALGISLLAMGLVCAGAAPAWAQTSDLQILLDRIDRLERDIRTLNRQIALGEGASAEGASTPLTPSMPEKPSASAASPLEFTQNEGALARVTLRVGELEHEVRQTTGLVEDMSYQLNQMNQRLDSLITGMNYRMSRLEGVPQGSMPPMTPSSGAYTEGGALPTLSPGVKAAPSTMGVTSEGEMAPPTALVGEVEQGTVKKDGTYVPPASGTSTLGSVSKTTADQFVEKGRNLDDEPEGAQDAIPAPTTASPSQMGAATDKTQTAMMSSATASPAAPAVTPPTSVLPEGTPKERYQFAFGLMRQARYDEAEKAMKAFIDSHGEDPLVSNAHYWLGETYYVRKSFMQAAQTFFQAYQSATDGPKAPDSLLKLGMSMGNLDKNEEACATYTKLRKEFKDLKTMVKKTLDREVKRLNCQ